MYCSFYIASVFFEIQVPVVASFLIQIIQSISGPIIQGLLIRFQRVQVQLRAQEENTIKIMKTIKRAKILEVVYVLILVVTQLCFAFSHYGAEVLSVSDSVAQAIDITGLVFEIAFICILSF